MQGTRHPGSDPYRQRRHQRNVIRNDRANEPLHGNDAREPLFSDLLFKIDEANGHAFKKLFVRHKKELVTLRYDKKLDPNTDGGGRLTPKEWHDHLDRDDVLILDGRSDYEYDLGHFRNAIRPDLETFREFPEWIRNNLTEHKDKRILTYCTGGIRCEMLTAVLKNEGFRTCSNWMAASSPTDKIPKSKEEVSTAIVTCSTNASPFGLIRRKSIFWLANAITAARRRTDTSTARTILAIFSTWYAKSARATSGGIVHRTASPMIWLLPGQPSNHSRYLEVTR